MQAQLATNDVEREDIDGDVAQFLTFVLNGEAYGIEILHIQEIIECGKITQVPMMPGFIAGVINLRGSVVPVVDLARRFSQASAERSKKSGIVILEVTSGEQSLEIGIIVDVVNEVLDICMSEIKSAPSFGTKIRNDFVCGMVSLDERLLVLLDIETILSVEELSVVGESSLG